jgi:hypothetical protein
MMLPMPSLRSPAHRLAQFALVLCCATSVHAQRGGGGFFGGALGGGEPVIKNIPYDGRFTFVRLTYEPTAGGYYYRNEPSWAHGYWENYPEEAEINLMEIMRQVSIFHPHVKQTNAIAITSPELFKYPVAYLTEGGFWQISDSETIALRKYLLKGGFLIVDDTRDDTPRDSYGRITFWASLQKLFPTLHTIKLDNTHPIFHSFFDFNKNLDDIPQAYDPQYPEFYGIFQDNDPKKRMYMMINFNTDISDFWEFTAQGFYPVAKANEAYELGVNYIMYAMTH